MFRHSSPTSPPIKVALLIFQTPRKDPPHAILVYRYHYHFVRYGVVVTAISTYLYHWQTGLLPAAVEHGTPHDPGEMWGVSVCGGPIPDGLVSKRSYLISCGNLGRDLDRPYISPQVLNLWTTSWPFFPHASPPLCFNIHSPVHTSHHAAQRRSRSLHPGPGGCPPASPWKASRDVPPQSHPLQAAVRQA